GTAGYHVPPGDAAALADALRTLASDRQRLTALRKEAHERALAEFSPSVVVRDLRERINALLA
ncbi:MAG TPA: glycosyltransferase family 1 protein, partial [Mycobacteriales bacterium]